MVGVQRREYVQNLFIWPLTLEQTTQKLAKAPQKYKQICSERLVWNQVQGPIILTIMTFRVWLRLHLYFQMISDDLYRHERAENDNKSTNQPTIWCQVS